MKRLLVPICLSLAACASAGNTTGDIPRTRTATGGVLVGGGGYGDTGGVESTTRESNIVSLGLAAPAPRLWPELAKLFEQLELPVSTADSTRMLIITTAQRLRTIEKVPVGRFFECPATGYGNSAGSGDVFVTVQAQLLPVSDALSELRMESQAHVRLATNNQVICRSTGRLERRFREVMTERSAGGGS